MTAGSGPVAIGGVGGSGTRIVAHLTRDLGFYIGDALNAALDNLWFVLLFRRPEWYSSMPAQAPIALGLFEKAMRGNPSLSRVERVILRDSVRELQKLDTGIPDWNGKVFKLARSLRSSGGPPTSAVGWGWKHPNSHIYLEQLAGVFPAMKYVHVIRNGLELVHKEKTRKQIDQWGPLFGVDLPDGPRAPAPDAALRYWIRANQRALRLGPKLLGDRFLVLKYESICADPRATLDIVSEFLGVRPRSGLSEKFSSFISVPPSHRDRSWESKEFDSQDLAEVEALGFPL